MGIFLVLQWHSLGREEQQVYYDKARKARQLHMEKFPGWSARDNYVIFFLPTFVFLKLLFYIMFLTG